ncbi:glycosyl hydrolase [Saccharibacillus sacchari]|uniref:glycosyl hydrolase n=1 Tax=Saccharibacillus sacchari TaxID=456493 RepID=UPI0004AD78F1|nr:glycosyl hydrolase [Saccharibacillus sacchari]
MWNETFFREPGAEYRIHPFWFWNGEMEPDQIVHQIEEMHEKGVGGFFVCPRQGLKISYLSSVWFDRVRLAVREAEARGMQVWLYDEYPYPSGMAGGEVLLDYPEANQRPLGHRSIKVKSGEPAKLELPWGRILYAKAMPIDGEGRALWEKAVELRSYIGNVQNEQVYQETGLTSYNRKRFFTYGTAFRLDWTAPAGEESEWEITVFQEEEIGDFKYYGGFVDPCHREAMSRFIELTHERYKAEIGETFGQTVKGIFTDEIAPLGHLPWSPRLPEFFERRCGYELKEALPALLDYRYPDAARIRYDYFQSLHLLLGESYHKQVGDWCEQAGIQYASEVPGVRMTAQRFSHMPGGDSAHEKTGRSLDWILDRYGGRMRDNPKMVSSLARQLDRPRNLSECFHSVGWSMTLQDAKWMVDRMAAMGTNFYNFHAFFYTIGGLTKHDAPPSQFLQNPYWAHFRQLGDYVGRVSYLMSEGEAHIPVALLDPTTTFWSLMGNPLHGFAYGGESEEEREKLERLIADWKAISSQLLKSRRDYDHLDPELLAEADVSDGVIAIGKARYEVLVLPPLLNLEAAAWEKVQQFADAGGTVISVGLLPAQNIQPGSPTGEQAADFFGVSGQTESVYWENGAALEPKLKLDATSGHIEKSFTKQGVGRSAFIPAYGSTGGQNAASHLIELLDVVLPEPVRWESETPCESVLMQLRQLPGDGDGSARFAVFLSNQEDRQEEARLAVVPKLLWPETTFGTDSCLQVEQLDLETGKVITLATLREEKGLKEEKESFCSLPLPLAPYEAKTLRLSIGSTSTSVDADSTRQPSIDLFAAKIRPSIEGPWQIRTIRPNVLRIGEFRLQAGDVEGVFLDKEGASVKPFIDEVADSKGRSRVPLAFGQEFGTPKRASVHYPIEAVYSAVFEADPQIVQTDMVLFMDTDAISGTWAMELNGYRLRKENFSVLEVNDHRNIACDVQGYMRAGENKLVIHVRIERDEDGLVDPLYIRGAFGVALQASAPPKLTPEPDSAKRISPEPLPAYPYYAGEMRYRRMFDPEECSEGIERGSDRQTERQFELELDGWKIQDVAEVLVNGQSLGVRCWSPYRWAGMLSDLRPGMNELEVRITNTLIGQLEGTYFDADEHVLRDVRPAAP